MKNKKFVFSMRTKAAVWFSIVMLISSVLAFVTSSLFTYQRTMLEYNMTLDHTASTITKLNKLGIPADEIVRMVSTPMYPAAIADNNKKYILTTKQKDELENSGLLYTYENHMRRTMFIKAGDNIIEVSINPKGNVFLTAILRTGLILIFSILLGVLFVTLSSKKMVKPIKVFTDTMQEVAKGDFSVRLPEPRHSEFGKIISNFNLMVKELGQIETLRKDFISNVSHEFKTPISSIHGFATLLSKSGLNDAQKEYANIIVSESSRLAKLSSNILKLSKLENQEIITEQKMFSLDEQLRQCLLILEKNWEEKNIDLEINFDKINYYGSKELLEQVWINLIDNAIKYTNYGGKISISCIKQSDEVIVSIKDNGIGMKKDIQNRIFEKFYQGDKAHSTEGNGLGLALVKRIVDLCGGNISVNSEENVGTNFTVKLPVS